MDFGLHLPLIDFGGNPFTLNHLIAYAETGQQLGFRALATNDHMVFSKPWLLFYPIPEAWTWPPPYPYPSYADRFPWPKRWVPSTGFRVVA